MVAKFVSDHKKETLPQNDVFKNSYLLEIWVRQFSFFFLNSLIFLEFFFLFVIPTISITIIYEYFLLNSYQVFCFRIEIY